MKEKKDDKKRELYLELQMLDSQIKQLEQQMIQMEQQIFEVNEIIQSLSDIKEVKSGTEILVPVANGIFTTAEIKDTKNLKVNVGAGITVEKTVEETKEMLKDQQKNIETYRDEVFLQLQQMVSKASFLQEGIGNQE